MLVFCLFFILKEFFIDLSYKSLPTVSTNIDFRLVKIDVDFRVSKSSSSSITPRMVTLDNDNRLFCHQVDGKLLIHLECVCECDFLVLIPILFFTLYVCMYILEDKFLGRHS